MEKIIARRRNTDAELLQTQTAFCAVGNVVECPAFCQLNPLSVRATRACGEEYMQSEQARVDFDLLTPAGKVELREQCVMEVKD